MKYIMGGFAALGLGVLAVWFTKARSSRDRWTELSGWEM